MGTRNSTTKYRAGPGFLLDRNGCIIDTIGCFDPCFPGCNPCLNSSQICNPCNPCVSICQPPCVATYSTFPCGQSCIDNDMSFFNPICYRDDNASLLNIYNFAYEKPYDPFSQCNPCYPAYSQRYIQPCFQKQYAQVSLNPFQPPCEFTELPYVQPFVQSFASWQPTRCETPVYPPLAMPAMLPNAQQFLNPFAVFCNQSYYSVPQPPPPPPPAPAQIYQQSYQPTYQTLQTPFQPIANTPVTMQQYGNNTPTPQQMQPAFQTSYVTPSSFFQPQSFQPTHVPQHSFQPIFQPMQSSCVQQSSFTRPLAMPYPTYPQMPQFINPFLEHFAQLSARPFNFTNNYLNPWI